MVFLITEFIMSGDLESCMNQNANMPQFSIITIFMNILECINTIHKAKIIHGALKLSNIMISL